jgi:predicted oxidoreductase
LPHNRVVDGHTRALVPHNCGFSLVRHPDTAHNCFGLTELAEALCYHELRIAPHLSSIVLNPTSVRQYLAMFPLSDTANIAGMVEQNRPGACGPMV